MKVRVQGVSIVLTKEQIEHIDKEKANQIRECKSFVRILKHFGFEKINTSSWPDPKDNLYSHPQHGWFADIQDYRTYKACFLTGKGLKSNGFPGGYVYESPESMAKEITLALYEMGDLS